MSDRRRPTVEEAVDHLRESMTRQYRRQCLTYWKEKFGAAFAEQVKNQYLKTKKGTK